MRDNKHSLDNCPQLIKGCPCEYKSNPNANDWRNCEIMKTLVGDAIEVARKSNELITSFQNVRGGRYDLK